MTCIVGVQSKGRVYLGGDSAATSPMGSQTIIADKKVFVNGNVAIGICGSPKVLDPLRMIEFAKQKFRQNTREYVVSEIIPKIKSALKESGCVIEHPEHGEIFQGSLLIGVKGSLYRIESNFQIITDAHGFDAIGSGADIALGSLHSTKNFSNPKKRIMSALNASATSNSGVRPPFAIVSVGGGIF